MNHLSPFTFLEAAKAIAALKDGKPYSLKICMSGMTSELGKFLKAEAAVRGLSLSLSYLQFDTLNQYLQKSSIKVEDEVFILCPWDLVKRLDWRSGLPQQPIELKDALEEANEIICSIMQRSPKAIIYLQAPIPPVGLNPFITKVISDSLGALVSNMEIPVLPNDLFDIGFYLASGCPISGIKLGNTAMLIAREIFVSGESKKVLITDLDETLWSGIIGEDGLEGINAAPEGIGFRHFLYQTFLRKLKNTGVLLAVVSRNNKATVIPALAPDRMPLSEKDFVAIYASYQPKSTQIAELAQRFNLGLDQFVFVDDNPIELEEVKGKYPEVVCLQFPKSEIALVELLHELHQLFKSNVITSEDQKRTEMYQVRAKGQIPITGSAHDVGPYLAGLEMRLTIINRSQGDRTRAVQLINKTNQFNLNGIRWSDEEVGSFLKAGGQLFTASLTDRNGEHGEILAALVGANGVIEAYVLSCRVFQRRVEYVFILWLITYIKTSLTLKAIQTDKNEPLWQFLTDDYISKDNEGNYYIDVEMFQKKHGATSNLFHLIFKD